MNIEILFSTKERIKILSHITYRTDYISVNKLAKDVKLSKGFVSKYLDSLTKEDVLRRTNGKFMIRNNIITRTIRVLLNMNMFDTNLFKGYKFIKSAGVYGSFTKGTNTEDSDIDLWVLIEKVSEDKLAKLTNELKKAFGNVKPLYMSEDKIKLLKKEDATFYHSLIFGSLVVYGDGIEAI